MSTLIPDLNKLHLFWNILVFITEESHDLFLYYIFRGRTTNSCNTCRSQSHTIWGCDGMSSNNGIMLFIYFEELH